DVDLVLGRFNACQRPFSGPDVLRKVLIVSVEERLSDTELAELAALFEGPDFAKMKAMMTAEIGRPIDPEALAAANRVLQQPVVKVFAPGMRHFWRRLGAGRLYDVPVAQGWLQHPTAEAQMNPRNVFF
ncbi:MAG: hypothetical protein ACMG6E_06430, partial [Candidatus Roizmanbacteria bacterium]